MQAEPLFSVLIANYNNGRYIDEAISSVMGQTYKNWEIVLIDDGSTDNSHEILNKYSHDNRIKIYFNNKNKGCGYTKNKCVDLSEGDLCAFLDPDDAIAQDAISIMVDLHLRKPNCSLIYSTLYVCNDLNKILYIEKERVGQIEIDEDFLVQSKKGITPFATFKRELYLKNVGIDKNLHSAVDIDLYFKLEEVGSLYFYDQKPLYYFRSNNPNSISIGTNEKIKSSYLNMMIASLNAIIRRINRKSELYTKMPDVYASQMRNYLNYFIRNKKNSYFGYQIRFFFYYLKLHKFTLKGLKHIVKMFI